MSQSLPILPLTKQTAGFVRSVFLVLSKTEPHHYVILFLFLQPFLGFTRNEVLDLTKHMFLRGFTLALLLYTLLWSSFTYGRIRLRSTGFERPLSIYVLGVLLPTIVAMARGETEFGRSVTSLVTLPILISIWFVTVFWIREKDVLYRAFRWFLYSVVIVCLIGCLEFIVMAVGGDFGTYRIRSVFVDPNIFARYVLCGMFLLIPFYVQKDKTLVKRETMAIMLVLFGISLLFSLSRSGYLTFVAGMILFAFTVQDRRVRRSIIFGTVIIGIMITIYLVSQRTFTGSAVVEPSNINRVQLILGGIEMIQRHWLLGIGYTNFGHYFERFYLENMLSISADNYKFAGYATEIHNWVIEVWAEQGIIGLGIFMYFFWELFAGIRRVQSQETDPALRNLLMGVQLIVFIFLFHGFFYHTFISQFFFWVLSGIGVAAMVISRDGAGKT